MDTRVRSGWTVLRRCRYGHENEELFSRAEEAKQAAVLPTACKRCERLVWTDAVVR